MNNNSNKYYILIIAITLLLIVSPFMIFLMADEATGKMIIAEGGPVDLPSALGYFVCIGYLLVKGGLPCLRNQWYLHGALLFFGLRELDFHKRFTTMGIFKSRFFLSPVVPAMEKIAAAAVLLLLCFIFWTLIRNHLKTFLQQLKSRNIFAVTLSLPILLLFVSKTIDGLARKLVGVGITISHQSDYIASTFEEIFELGIPVLFFVALVIYFDREKSSRSGEQV